MNKQIRFRDDVQSRAISGATKRGYALGIRRFMEWCRVNDVDEWDDEATASYYVDLYEEGLAPTTITTYARALGYWAAKNDLPNVCGVAARETLAGILRLGEKRGRGQAEGLTLEDYEKIMATALDQRTWSNRSESKERAERRGRVDRAIVTLLFMGAMRRSEVAALCWKDVDLVASSEYVYIRVCRSKTNRDGHRLDIRLLKGVGAAALRDLRAHTPANQERVLGLHSSTVAYRFIRCCRYVGLVGRYTSHSGRIGLASELSAAGAPITEIAKAGNWQSPEMVIHYSRRASLERGAVATYLNVPE